MIFRTKHFFATTALAVTAVFSTVAVTADPETDFSNDALTQSIENDSLSAPLGLVDAQDTRTVDGTGLRAISEPGTETVDGTGFMRSVSDPSIDTVDGTGLRLSPAANGTETVDGTGRLRSLSPSSADSGQSLNLVEPESDEPGE